MSIASDGVYRRCTSGHRQGIGHEQKMCPRRGDRTPRPNANAHGEASTQPHDSALLAEHSGGLPRSVTAVNTAKDRRGDLQRSHKSYSASCSMKESTKRRHGASVCASESLLRTLPSVPRKTVSSFVKLKLQCKSGLGAAHRLNHLGLLYLVLGAIPPLRSRS